MIFNPFAGAFKLFYDNSEVFRNKVNSIFNSIRNGISNAMNGVTSAVRNGLNKAVSFITSLPGQAKQWGKDFIQGLIDGINAKVSKVVNAVKGVPNKITSFLHFSVPDEGPLTDYES